MSQPTITSIHAYRLNPTAIKESWDDGYVWPRHPPSFLVKVTGTTGAFGVGEVTSQPWYYGETAEKLSSVLRLYDSALRGLPIDRVAEAHKRMERGFSGGVPAGRGARSAVDMALHDLLGRSRGVPVYSLLGGALRTDFDMLANLYHKTPETMAKAASGLVADGYKGLKIKVGDVLLSNGWSRETMEAELGRLQAALDAVPRSVYIDVDANQGWLSAKWTVSALGRFASYDNLSTEQPLHYGDLAGAAFVRAHSRAPLILDESVWSPQAMMQIIRSEACDRISLKLGRVGGFFPATQIIAMCDAAGIGVSLDTSPYTLIGDTASCHAAATIDTPYPIDCDGHVSYLTMGNPSPFLGGVTLEEGRAYLPDKPGLGVEVDWLQIGEPEPWCDRP